MQHQRLGSLLFFLVALGGAVTEDPILSRLQPIRRSEHEQQRVNNFRGQLSGDFIPLPFAGGVLEPLIPAIRYSATECILYLPLGPVAHGEKIKDFLFRQSSSSKPTHYNLLASVGGVPLAARVTMPEECVDATPRVLSTSENLGVISFQLKLTSRTEERFSTPLYYEFAICRQSAGLHFNMKWIGPAFQDFTFNISAETTAQHDCQPCTLPMSDDDHDELCDFAESDECETGEYCGEECETSDECETGEYCGEECETSDDCDTSEEFDTSEGCEKGEECDKGEECEKGEECGD